MGGASSRSGVGPLGGQKPVDRPDRPGLPWLGQLCVQCVGTKVGRLVAAEFGDPARLAALGIIRFRRFAANRNVQVSGPMADRLVAAARVALPTWEAAVARQVIPEDLALLAAVDNQVQTATGRIAALIPATDYAVLLTGPGWGTCRVGAYAAGVGDMARWSSHRQIYRASGLTPTTYESTSTRVVASSISTSGRKEAARADRDVGATRTVESVRRASDCTITP
ncbi:hypothetical protein BH24ACT15_BH24ACT15_38540 [soil metagenome]